MGARVLLDRILTSAERSARSRAKHINAPGRTASGSIRYPQTEAKRNYSRQWAREHKDTLQKYRDEHEEQRLNKYGLDFEAFDALLLTQCGCCPICGNVLNGEKRWAIHIDHDHQTKKVRGILCNRCNTTLGRFQDDVNILRNAIHYLQNENSSDTIPLTLDV